MNCKTFSDCVYKAGHAPRYMIDMEMKLQYQPFCVNKAKYIVVYWDLIAKNSRFLTEFDPEYFSFIAMHCYEFIQSNHTQKEYFAAQLRTIYAQALEAMFAFLFAMLQAPLCQAAWLSIYSQKDLRKLVSTICSRSSFLYFKIKLPANTWRSIASFITPIGIDATKYRESIDRLEIILESLAKDFLDDILTLEYNCIKHGFRVRLGGFQMAIGNTSDNLHPLGKSDFGSNLLRLETVGNKPEHLKDVNIFSFRQTHLNWDPKYLSKRTELVSNILKNIRNLSLALHGDKNSEFEYWWCDDDMEMREYLINRSGIFKCDIDRDIDGSQISDEVYRYDHEAYYKEKMEFIKNSDHIT